MQAANLHYAETFMRGWGIEVAGVNLVQILSYELVQLMNNAYLNARLTPATGGAA